jgi:hypothetical protein
MPRGLGWSNRDAELLRGYWASDVPLNKIVYLFGGKFSSSAICGKATRMKLPTRRGNIRNIRASSGAMPYKTKQDAMIALHKARWSVEKIAKLFRCETSTVRIVLSNEKRENDCGA